MYHSHQGQRTHGRTFNRSRFDNRGGGFNRNRSRGNSHGKQNRAETIHHSKFINKSEGPIENEVYVPKHAFADFAIDERIKANIAKKGYTTPTPIQDQSITHILEGRDIVGIANTGTGKTGAFLIPLLDKVAKGHDERVLIMVPTRELAIQIEEEYKGFSHGSGLRSVCAVGGMNITPQIRALKAQPYFVIGTPGRLKDLMERRALDLSQFRTVVLDEADRMLDMGFIADMRFILSQMPEERHTLFFSATLSPEIDRLIGDFLNDPVRVSVKMRDTSKDVDQDIVKLQRGEDKIARLAELLRDPEFKKVIIFGRTKYGVEKLSKALNKYGFNSVSIHGNKSHAQRQKALQDFKSERAPIMIATDVAARGLDIPKVSHVINFDQPNTYDDYVHRIGRTGRAGERGKALTFVE